MDSIELPVGLGSIAFNHGCLALRADHNALHNYKVIYIVYRFMYVNYVLILEYKDVVVTGK